MLDHNAQKRPDSIAIYCDGRQHTFKEHHENAQRLAAALLELGCQEGERVAIISRNSVEYLELYAACALAGIILVPVNFRLSDREVGWVCENTQPRVFFYTPEYEEARNFLSDGFPCIQNFICIDEAPGRDTRFAELRNSVSNCQLDYRANEQDAACIVHTSGTTGKAKGAVLGQGGLYAVANAIATDAAIEETDVGLVMQPLFHVGARFLQLAHHARGAAIRLEREFEPTRVWKILAKKQVTTIQVVPTMLAVLLEQYQGDYPSTSLNTIFYSTAPIANNLLRKGLSVFGQVFLQQYGSTEAGQVTSLAKSLHMTEGNDQEQAWLQSAGQVNKGVEMQIIDGDNRPVSAGEVGEICVKNPWLFLGYWNDKNSTRAAMLNGYLRMGDMGYLDERGFLYIVDRKKDMIISGGENIYPREVELALEKHQAVSEVAVIGIPDERWGESVLAVVVCREEAKVGESELIAHCQAHIASYKKPRKVLFVDALPRNSMGKVDKPAIRAPWWSHRPGQLV